MSLTALDVFNAAVARAGKRPFLEYFGATLSYSEVARMSDALAVGLMDRGFRQGDRFCAYLQNVPHFIIAMLGVWKAGGVFVPVNPMNQARELAVILDDCEPRAILAEPGLLERLDPGEGGHRPDIILFADPSSGAGSPDARVIEAERRAGPESAENIDALIASFGGQAPPLAALSPDDIATLIYTSGTTGRPKGAINLHRGIALGGKAARNSHEIAEFGTVLALAPLFHVTGVVLGIMATIDAAGLYVLRYRFHPDVMIDAIKRCRPQVATGSITAFIALMNAPSATREALASLTTPMSGGAPVPAAVVDAFEEKFGVSLRTGYGLTESSGPAFMEPLGEMRRVDPETGSLSVGKLLPGYGARILDDDGHELPAGEPGEVVLTGEAVSPGYWHDEAATAETMRPDGLRTGDIGFFDRDGWLYLVDRKKDMIIAGGYKVWPREVEDVLYSHPAVREVAVVGAADAYRGETVRAVVSLKAGNAVSAGELIGFCRERLAAYKVPRIVDLVAELPKSQTGKILRREVRQPVA